MKTVLFFYYDKILEQTKCDCYLVKDVQKCIDWRTQIYTEEMKQSKITNLTIKIADSFHFATMTRI